MTDPELERLLKQYRPVGPPPGLSERVLGGSAAPPVAPGRVWPWAAAAAVLLCVTVGLHVARVQLQRAPAAADARISGELQMIAAMLTAGEERDEAIDEARRILWERQLKDLVEAPVRFEELER